MKKKLFIGIIMFFVVAVPIYASNNLQQIIYEDSFEQQKTFISPNFFGYNLYRIHIALTDNSLLFDNVSFFSDHVDFILSIKEIISYNILDLLEFQQNKLGAMESYLSQLDYYLLKSDFYINMLKQEMSSFEFLMQDCTSQKNIADKNYIDAIKGNLQGVFLQQFFESSKKNAKCVSEAKVEYSARKVLLDKILAYRSILKMKYDYLSKNKDNIVENYLLIKGDVLNKLLMIKHMLEKYDM